MIHRFFFARPTKLRRGLLILAALSLPAFGIALAVEKVNFEELLDQAKAAYANGKPDEAVKLATQAVEAAPKNPSGYFVRARFYQERHEPAKAVADYNRALEFDPRLADAWQQRGGEHFKLGHIQESIADFEKFIALVPQQSPYHWQRGISLYYAGRFEDGRKQFESHQTVNSNDVENAVWHFLCVARSVGLEKARTSLIPIQRDARVPMMEVHALFAAKATPEEVLKAAGAGGGPTLRLNRQMFYAHLYLGLYFEAIGDDKQSREHINQAAGTYRTDDYMGDVARVHQQLRWPKQKPSAHERK